MAARFDTWESYFYPETYDRATDTGTLVNLFGERDAEVLQRKEYARTDLRYRQLRTGQVGIDRTWDAEHLRAIHRHLFQDVYPWAGEYRTVAMEKNISRFADPVDIDSYLDRAHRTITQTAWAQLDRNEFAAAAAQTFAYVNQAHPFREGNGRASRLFMQQVAEQSRFRITYDPGVTGVSDELWNQQSMLSGPDLGSYEPVPRGLVPVFYALAQPAPDRDPQVPGEVKDQAREAARLAQESHGQSGGSVPRRQQRSEQSHYRPGKGPGSDRERGR